MKQVIRKREYNTETASVVYKRTVGFYGDPAGYEEILFQTPEGLYFVYQNGGPASPCPQETISSLAKTKMKAWLAEHQSV